MAKMNEAQREVLSQVRSFVGSNAFVESIKVENIEGTKDVHVEIETESYSEPYYKAARCYMFFIGVGGGIYVYNKNHNRKYIAYNDVKSIY